MKHVHVNESTLRQILDRGQDALAMRLLLHQLATCKLCFDRLSFIHDLYREGILDEDCTFTGVDVFLGLSRLRAPKLWAELENLPAEEWPKAVEAPKFQSWGLCELVCDLSRKNAGADSMRALSLAELAVVLAGTAQCSYVPESFRPELEMLAHAHLGNALRVRGDLRAARECFEKAEERWYAAEDDFLDYRPTVMTLRASWHIAERSFDQALEAVQEALILNRYQAKPRADLESNALILKSMVLVETDRVEEASLILDEVARKIVPEDQPALWLVVRHNQLDYLTRLGRFEAAQDLLPEVEQLAVDQGREIDRLRIEWCKARIHQGVGDLEPAIELFGQVQAEFLERGLGYNAAIVSLELATVYFESGRTEEVQRLAVGMLPIFESQDVHREALGALNIFQKAAAMDKISKSFLGELLSYLHSARTNPSLRFSSGS